MKTVSNGYSDFGYDIIPVSSGGYLLTARFSTDPNYWKLIAHQLIWKKNFNIGNYAMLYKVVETPNGDFVICGGNADLGGFILKTNA